jgi:dipeptidase E
MNGKILLAGGGEAQDSFLLDREFARCVGSDGKVLFWPFARSDSRTFDSALEWFRQTYGALGIRNVSMWKGLTNHQARELGAYTAVYIAGGNTYWLLAQLLRSGFDRHLSQYVQGGGMVYGGSAGAVVLGWDIGTIAHLDINQINLRKTGGLDLAHGYAIWVHYQLEDDKLIQEYVHQHGHELIALSERSGVVVDSTGIHSFGYQPTYIFDLFGKKEI